MPTAETPDHSLFTQYSAQCLVNGCPSSGSLTLVLPPPRAAGSSVWTPRLPAQGETEGDRSAGRCAWSLTGSGHIPVTHFPESRTQASSSCVPRKRGNGVVNSKSFATIEMIYFLISPHYVITPSWHPARSLSPLLSSRFNAISLIFPKDSLCHTHPARQRNLASRSLEPARSSSLASA